MAADGLTATLPLDPVPLAIGAPFARRAAIDRPARRAPPGGPARAADDGQGDRQSAAREETITVWAGRLAEAGEFGGTARTYAFDGHARRSLAPDHPDARTGAPTPRSMS